MEWLDGSRAQRVLLAASAALTVVYTVWCFTGFGPAGAQQAISDLLPLGVEACSVVLLCSAARAARARASRRAWYLIAAGFGAFFVGDLLWAVLELGFGTPAFPSVADVFYLAMYPLLMVGLLCFPTAPRSTGEQVRTGLDIAMIVVGGFIVVYYVVLGPLLTEHTTDGLTTALSVAYPVGDLMVLFAIGALVLRGATGLRPAQARALATSQVAFFVADLVFGAQNASGDYHGGGLVDASWVLAVQAAGLAACLARSHRDGADASVPDDLWRAPRSPYLALAVGYGVVALVAMRQDLYPAAGVMSSSVLLSAVVVARQASTMRENERLVARLQRLATTDPLTGVANRLAVHERAPGLIRRSVDSNDPVTALMIDIDRFKAVNDTYGHAAGDAVLVAVAETVAKTVPPGTLVARFGGDELVALVPGIDQHEAELLVERLRAAVGDLVIRETPKLPVTISTGAATTWGEAPFEQLIARADEALYRAKSAVGAGTGRRSA